MAKICKYELVKCPFCGSKEVVDCYRGVLRCNLGTSVVKKIVHVVRCEECFSEFAIPYKD